MLDIRFIRDNAEVVEKKSLQKGYRVDIKHLLELDDKRRGLMGEIEKLRAERNNLAEKLKKGHPTEQQLMQGKSLKKQLHELEASLGPIDKEYETLLKAVPNMPLEDVPVGASEKENQVAKDWGDKPSFDFQPKTHWEIGEGRGLIDKGRAARVAGSRFVYLKGDLAKLQFALIQFTINILTDEKKIEEIVQQFKLEKISTNPFQLILPPLMIRTEIFDAMDRLEPKEDRYKIEKDDLWLQGSAEHTLGPMHMGELLPIEQQPIRYLGYATSFRREAGTYGKDTEGIIRMHQFDKLEMESFSAAQAGRMEHSFLIAVQEYLMQQLMLPYRVIRKCTADIGKPNASGVDIEVWMPGAQKYLETHTADYMTDYQTRRLGIKFKRIQAGPTAEHNTNNPPTELAHTNDATAFAMGRTLAAIMENYQNKDGSVRVPDALQPYFGTKTAI